MNRGIARRSRNTSVGAGIQQGGVGLPEYEQGYSREE